MDAIRIARVTGRDTIVKIFGSYHGHHDYAMVSISRAVREDRRPRQLRLPALRRWHPKRASDLTIAVPFNDTGAMERRIERLSRRGRPPACRDHGSRR